MDLDQYCYSLLLVQFLLGANLPDFRLDPYTGTAIIICNNGPDPHYVEYGLDTFRYGMCHGTR